MTRNNQPDCAASGADEATSAGTGDAHIAHASSDSRRRFIFKSAALLPATVALGACEAKPTGETAGSGSKAASGTIVTAAPEIADKVHAPRYFTADEWIFVRAATARLVPADENGPGALELDVPVFIDVQMEGAFGHAAHWYMQGPFKEADPSLGYQSRLTPREVYRLGIAATNQHCTQQYGKAFALLTAADQDKVLHQLDKKQLNFADVDAKTFFDFLLGNTIEGYLADPLHGGNKDAQSWKMIGFPGARADFVDFVGQNKPYPYGPVGVLGKET